MSKRILLQNGKILLDSENKVLTTEDGTSALKLVSTGTIVKNYSNSIEISNVNLKEKTQYVLRLWNSPGGWWDILTFVYIDGEEDQYVTITNADEDKQIVKLYSNANTSIILGGSSSDTFIYDNGSDYELYEVQGGGSSTSTSIKLKKQNYIKRINTRENLLNGNTDGEFEVPHTLALFNEPVDIVIEQPRSRRTRSTPTQPSLYRPLGGKRLFTNINTLTLKDIFLNIFSCFTEAEIDTIINTGIDVSRTVGNDDIRHRKYIIFHCDKYSLENRPTHSDDIFSHLISMNRDNAYRFVKEERYNCKLLRFFFKPVKNYEIVYDYDNRVSHYTYLTGVSGIEIGIKLSFDNKDTFNDNKLKILLTYQQVKIE